MRRKSITKCQKCGKDFHPFYHRRTELPQLYCSRKCYLLARWGKSPSRYCLQCGKDITSIGDRSHKYCSWECYRKSKRGKSNQGRSNLETHPCSWCGEDVTRPASNFCGEKVFCNRHCMAEWQSEFQCGENHPNWKGGSLEIYGFIWRKARKDTLIRANFICQRCHKHKSTLVHHLLPIRFFSNITDAHFASNLTALCGQCHAKEHRRLATALPLLDLLQFQR